MVDTLAEAVPPNVAVVIEVSHIMLKAVGILMRRSHGALIEGYVASSVIVIVDMVVAASSTAKAWLAALDIVVDVGLITILLLVPVVPPVVAVRVIVSAALSLA